MLGCGARLTYTVTTKGGDEYKKGSLWRIQYLDRGEFTISGIKPDGSPDDPVKRKDNHETVRSIRCMGERSLEIDPRVPIDPKYAYEKPVRRKREEEDDDDD